MRRVQEVEAEVLTRPGRYREVAGNLQVKEVWVGDGERRKRYVLCLNPLEAERQRAHRQQVLVEIDAELTALDKREDDHPKAACTLDGVEALRPLPQHRPAGAAEAGYGQGEGGGEIRRQVCRHHQRRYTVGGRCCPRYKAGCDD